MRAVRVIFALLAVIMLALPISADESYTYSIDDFDTDDILSVLPEEVRARLPDGNVFDAQGFEKRFSVEYFLNLAREVLFAALSPALKTFSVTLGLVVISSLLSALKRTLHGDSLAAVFDIASSLCLMLTLYNTVASLCGSVRIYLAQLQNIVGAMVPVTVAIGTAGGNISASAVSASAMMLGVAFVEFISAGGLYPILQLCFGFAIASGVGKDLRLGALTKIVRDVFIWVLGFVSALISAVMTFQNSIAARADSLSMRAIKFAASKTVPVVGGIASDAVSTVAQSLDLVRGTVGWVGVIIIIIMTLPVMINVILTRLGILLSQSAADVLGLEREGKVLSEAVGLLGFLASVCFICALMFVYALTIFAKSCSALV